MADSMLTVSSLKKIYSGGSGISGIDLEIRKGTIHGFLGQNGAGKSTTMKCIMGLVRVDSGSMSIGGEPYVPGDTMKRNRIGFLPEFPSYPSYMTPEECLIVFGRIRGLGNSSLKEETIRLLETVGLSDVRHKRLSTFSKGMSAKFGIAFALLGNPELLILDEPTSSLDPVVRATVQKLFRKLVSEGHTILLSSHQIGEVQEICHEVTVINKGKTVAAGPVEDLRTQQHGRSYLAEFTQLDSGLLEKLRALEGVVSADAVEEKGKTRIRVEGSGDYRPVFARAAFASGSMMIGCDEEKKSLEELFFNIIDGDGKDRELRKSSG